MKMLEQNILKVLAYFDVFHYPVSLEEIRFFISEETGEVEILKAIKGLESQGIVFRIEGFVSLKNDPALILRRKEGNKKAELLLPKAKQLAKLLYFFPFVRGVGISGSLSKNFADENSDFDYFVITKANRLWIARTLMGFLKKASYLVRKPHWFCFNYYIDEYSLKIPENNIFTATELLTLIAGAGNGTLNEFFKTNNWANNYYPVYNKTRFSSELTQADPFIKQLLESLFNNWLGNKIDNWLMNRSVKRWEKKKQEGSLTDLKGREIELPLTSKNYCKQNPEYFQAKVLNAFRDRLELVEGMFNVLKAPVSSENR